jgi:SAM-dependent methyltransferase
VQPKPKHLEPQYGAQFKDQSVAEAYPTRPPYPPEVFRILLDLIEDEPRILLDLGCGTGDIARPLAPHVERVDAVDPSAAMLARGRALPGGDHPHLHWMNVTAEEFDYPSRYSLVTTAESLHWMDWHVVLPKIARALSGNGRLAIVRGRRFLDVPWDHELYDLINTFSTNHDYRPYDLLQELGERDLFLPEGSITTSPVPFTQPVDDYIESFHSRNGLSRQRMGERAEEFDRRLRDIVMRYSDGSQLQFRMVASVAWGRPAGGEV